MSSIDAKDITQSPPDRIVQYIVVRIDLWKEHNWPLGSVIAQACHASSAALWLFKDDPFTQQYLTDIDNMTKVVLEIKSLEQLNNLSQKLNEAELQSRIQNQQLLCTLRNLSYVITNMSLKMSLSIQRTFSYDFQRKRQRPIFASQLPEQTHGEHTALDRRRHELKQILTHQLSSANRGIFGLKTAVKSDILKLLAELEVMNPTSSPTEHLSTVAGEWRLLYSTISITGSKRTKLGLREFVTLGEFIQIVDINKSTATNVVNFEVLGFKSLNGSLTIDAAYEPIDEKRVAIHLLNAKLEPEALHMFFVDRFEMLLEIFNPAGWLDITYVDASHRIGRDDKNNVFYLERKTQ